jgi:hypothetical protein
MLKVWGRVSMEFRKLKQQSDGTRTRLKESSLPCQQSLVWGIVRYLNKVKSGETLGCRLHNTFPRDVYLRKFAANL